MKKQLLFFLVTILSFSSYSQISFKKGYYINNNNQKINCLINTIDWNNNPTEIEYKLLEKDKPKKVTLKFIKEFGVDNNSKYIRAKVDIDRSSKVINKISAEKNPKFKKEELFLRVLIESKANLYQYLDDGLTRYFYKTENSNIQQLVFKSYKTDENKIGENKQFRQQLFDNLKCENLDIKQFENTNYNKNSLIQFFEKYNECQKSDLIYSEPKVKREVFNLTIRPRLNSSSMSVESDFFNSGDIINFGNKTGVGIGLEAEFILPIRKNKWAILIEPTYQSFKAEITENDLSGVFGGTLISKVEYSAIETPISLRHYLFLNKNSNIFIDASYILAISSNSFFEFKNALTSDTFQKKIDKGQNLGFGIGYKLLDKYSLQLRYQTSRDLLGKDPLWSSNYKILSAIFGYSIF